MKTKSTKILLLSLILCFSQIQSAYSQKDDEGLDGIVDETKQDIMLVLGGGLAGAILGLSTLSFVDEPKEHTRNILVGASLGIIVGVAFVAFNQANKSRDLIYSSEEEFDEGASLDFQTFEREQWHSQVSSTYQTYNPYNVGVSFRY